jgi:hypothetical protein
VIQSEAEFFDSDYQPRGTRFWVAARSRYKAVKKAEHRAMELWDCPSWHVNTDYARESETRGLWSVWVMLR